MHIEKKGFKKIGDYLFFYSSPKSVANRCYTNPKGAAYSNGCWTKCAFGAIIGSFCEESFWISAFILR